VTTPLPLFADDDPATAVLRTYIEKHRHWVDCGRWLEEHMEDARWPERSRRLEQMTVELSQALQAISEATGMSRKELIQLAEKAA
jgi:hypothetical protein